MSADPAAPARTDQRPAGATRRIGVLVASNLLGGVGVASGIAVGGLLAERLGGTEVAGLAQAAGVLGAAVAAIPLARVASRRGRRASLTLGYLLATLGAVVTITAAVVDQLLVLLAGLALFGVAQAANLQSRYAAGDNAPAASRGRVMSIVIWATTIGSVAGPNLADPGNSAGIAAGLPDLAGPYLFSLAGFTLAGLVLAIGYGSDRSAPGGRRTRARSAAGKRGGGAAGDAAPAVRTGEALGWALRHPVAGFAVVLTACAHAVMVMVMVMTPVHMSHHGDGLAVVGVVISLHVLGMYAASPLFGWLADRLGGVRTAVVGMGTLLLAIGLGLVAASVGGPLTAVALTVLGLGWSACLISASTLLATATSDRVRIPLQGATDAGMNYAGAAAAALAGPILAWGGFHAVNTAALVLLIPAAVLVIPALRAHRQRAGADAGT